MPTLARRPTAASFFAAVALAFAGLLTDEEADAVARPGWAFAGWEGLAFDDCRAAKQRRMTRPRLLAGARLAAAWLGSRPALEPDALAAELSRFLGTTLERALAAPDQRAWDAG
jgi:hypothetical protein